MSNSTSDGEEPKETASAGPSGDDELAEHLAGLDDGAGCTEIWEKLSEARANES